LPLTAFVSFLQNHDQIGNRAFGERIATVAKPEAVRAATEILLVAPSIPLLFMGEEFGATTPFLFFCNFEKDLAEAVSAGRRNEFARFLRFNDSESREGIPDPNAESTFERSKLDWEAQAQPDRQAWLSLHRDLMDIRRKYIWPRPLRDCKTRAEYEMLKENGLHVQWRFSDGSQLTLLANLSDSTLNDVTPPSSEMIYASAGVSDAIQQSILPAWSVAWSLRA
jgi:1,4-alpha-glucan branching enzyme